MKASISVFPMIQKHRTDSSGRAPLLIRIDLKGKPVAYDKMGTKANKIPLEMWDADRRAVRSQYCNAAILNNIIKTRVAELEGIFLFKEQQGATITAGLIKALVQGFDTGQDFYAFCERQISEKYDNPDTRRTYRGEINKLKVYRECLSFNEIDYQFLQGYSAYLRDSLGNSSNTIWKTFKFMNTMMNDALKIGGLIEKNPFDTFDRGRFKQTSRTFLTKMERPLVEKLLEQDLPREVLVVTAYYLLMVYCGLRYEDAMRFDYDTHVIDDERLVMVTQKKKYPLNIKLYPKLREIMLFIKQNPVGDALWKKYNHEFNAVLRLVAHHAKIDKHLTAHTGRHSFGRLLAEKGIDKKKAQKLLGHFDERATNVYYHILDTDLDDEVDGKLGDL